MPEPTLRELAQLRAASEERGAGVTKLELAARRQDLASRLAQIAERGGVDMAQLWLLLGEMGGVAPALSVVATEPTRVITEHRAVVDGRNLQEVLREEAVRTTNDRLVEAINRGFKESFEFIKVPANPEKGVPTAFELQTTHTTQGQILVWRYLRGEISKEFLPEFRGPEYAEGDHIDLGDGITANYDHPAEMLSAFEADEFAAWLSQLPAVVATGCRYDLLTEAQYQQALRWSLGLPFGQDEIFSADEEVLEYAYGAENSVYPNGDPGTHAVSGLNAMPHGFRHLVGNVSTWTKDLNGSSRVIRGGCCLSGERSLRLSYCSNDDPSGRYDNLGARLVRTCP